MIENKLSEIALMAKNDISLAKRIVETQNKREPLIEFCKIANELDFDFSPGDIIALGQDYSCNQLKSTNGGGVNPYDFYDDPYEMLIVELLDYIKRSNQN